MKRNILYGSLLAAALSVGVGAQSTPPPSAGQAGTGSSAGQEKAQSSSRDQITVTGCLQSAGGASGATGTTGSASKSSKPDDFILASATTGAGASAAGAPAGQAGAATGTTGSGGSQYKLTGKTDELKQMVNSKVEIRGKLDSAAGASPSGAPATSSASGQTLHVDSVKQIAASCSQ
jgi:hypothetical protein